MDAGAANWTTATDENGLRRLTATFRMSRMGHRYRPKRRTARGAPDTAPRGVAPIFYTARFGNVAPSLSPLPPPPPKPPALRAAVNVMSRPARRTQNQIICARSRQ